MKTCGCCGGTDFYESGRCKPCTRARVSAYQKASPEKAAAWREANREKRKSYKAEWVSKNRAKVNADNRAWKEANPDKKRASDTAWHASNPEKTRSARAARYIKNKDFVLAANAAWKAKNKGAVVAHNRNRKAKKKTSGTLTSDIALRLIVSQKGKCACCGLPLGDDYHLDHIMPLALGGTNTDDNIQLLRSKCNLQKGTKHPVDFMQQRGFLL